MCMNIIHILFYVYIYSVSFGAFAIGMKFEYWHKYKENKDRNEEEKEIREDYIERKYDTFKEEMLNYDFLSIKQLNKEIIPKVNEYLKSNIVKSIKNNGVFKDLYLIEENESIKLDHLLSVTLYTDYSKLSADFTSTFRKKWRFEPLEEIKRRNRKYWWWSKLLTETVMVYGNSYDDNDNANPSKNRNPLKGPFYTGMNHVMNMPQFNIDLLSPTSTSVHIEVATRFGGESGMILQFNNDSGSGQHTFGWDCSWLSRFKEEDERYTIHHIHHCLTVIVCICYFFVHRLFFRTNRRLSIVSIRIMEDASNLEKVIEPISFLDECLTDPHTLTVKKSKSHYNTLRKLFDITLGNDSSIDTNKYILGTFRCFIRNKTRLYINFENLKKAFKDNEDDSFLDLFLFKMNEVKEWNESKFERRDESDYSNLIKPDIFKVFTNIEEITIDIMGDSEYIVDGHFWEYGFYTLSLIALLSIMKETNVRLVIVEAYGFFKDKSWLEVLWNTASQDIIDKFSRQQFNITFDHRKDDEYVVSQTEDKIIIERI